MSTDLMRLIPTDPEWVPDEVARRRTMRLLAELAPAAAEITERVHDEIVFVDAGSSTERVDCPACGTTLATEWWIERVSRAYERGFRDLAVRTPCCGTDTSLNDLRWVWPVGFARAVVTARDPDRGLLTAAELERVAHVLGHPVREVRASY